MLDWLKTTRRICARCHREYTPSAPNQEYCGSKLIQGTCSYIVQCEKKRAWRHSDPERYRQIRTSSRQSYRARRQGAEGRFTVFQWNLIRKLFNFTCPGCGRKEPEIKLTADHKIPLSHGGSNHFDNIQPLCTSCNSIKRDKAMLPAQRLADHSFHLAEYRQAVVNFG
jgi:5-methylcytosine-specific restriction endonuclease McrA